MRECQLLNNTAIHGENSHSQCLGKGGAIYTRTGDIYGSNFTHNMGLCNKFILNSSRWCYLLDHFQQSDGMRILQQPRQSYLLFLPVGDGGALYSSFSVAMRACQLTNNTALNGKKSLSIIVVAGAIYTAADGDVNGSDFTNNSARCNWLPLCLSLCLSLSLSVSPSLCLSHTLSLTGRWGCDLLLPGSVECF